jgi:hypothetical protein
LQLEHLECRYLPTIAWPTALQPTATQGHHEVLDQAAELPISWTPNTGGQPASVVVGTTGTLGAGPAGAADVDWYHFSLDRAARVTLGTFSQANGTVLSLYNTDGLFSDPYDPLGHRLLVQEEAPAGGDQDSAPIMRDLAAGDYYVAVSGAGNLYFHPFIAGSGYAGGTGAYRLLFQATDLDLTSADLPRVLAIDPAGHAIAERVYDRSPTLIRVDLSGPVDPNAVNASVTNISAPGGGNFVAGITFSSVANELTLNLTAPLLPGTYEVVLSAQGLAGAPVLGADASLIFNVAGIDGNTALGAGPDNTLASARELNLAGSNPVQIAGAIGDDPTRASPFDPNSVDVYHFQVTDAIPSGLTAEVFAGRIGSPLLPALSLFEQSGNQLHLVALNTGTGNPEPASGASPVLFPLLTDPALYVPLTPGDYYLVVSALGNTPDPFGGDIPLDPTTPLAQSFGGFAFQGGAYVLNVQVQSAATPPEVTAVTGLSTDSSADPPAQFVVQFSEAVNLQQLAFAALQNTLSAVSIQGPGGSSFSPHFASFNPATNEATFVVVDRLPPGAYQLHLSGVDPSGPITDIAGNPLVGNDASGDFVYDFNVGTLGHGTAFGETANDGQHPQDLGVLAPFDLADGVTVTGGFGAEGADYYQFQVLQARPYTLSVQALPTGTSVPLGNWLTMTNLTTGTTMALIPQGTLPNPADQVNTDGQIQVLAFLQPGAVYRIGVASWAAGPTYQLQLTAGFNIESPPPLTTGPGTAIRVRLLNNGNDPQPPPVLPPNPPSPPGPVSPPTRTAGTGAAHASPPDIVPADVLLGLAAGPVGGVNSLQGATPAQDAFDRIFARAPMPLLSDAILRVAVLPLHFSTDTADGSDSTPAIQSSLAERASPWQGLLDSLWALWNSVSSTSAEKSEIALPAAPESIAVDDSASASVNADEWDEEP